MLEKFLRSPFMMMVMLIIVGIVSIGAKEGWPFSIYYFPFIGIMIIYFVLLFYHNKKFPKRKLKVFTIVPYELREDDEGLQYFTFKAMRKVYIFYYFAIPAGILLLFVFNNVIPNLPICLLVVFGITQYFIYWFEMRKAFTEED